MHVLPCQHVKQQTFETVSIFLFTQHSTEQTTWSIMLARIKAANMSLRRFLFDWSCIAAPSIDHRYYGERLHEWCDDTHEGSQWCEVGIECLHNTYIKGISIEPTYKGAVQPLKPLPFNNNCKEEATERAGNFHTEVFKLDMICFLIL